MQQKQELTFTTKITAPTHIRSSDMSGAQGCKLHFHYWSSFQHRGAWACVLQHDTIHTCTCFLQLFLFPPIVSETGCDSAQIYSVSWTTNHPALSNSQPQPPYCTPNPGERGGPHSCYGQVRSTELGVSLLCFTTFTLCLFFQFNCRNFKDSSPPVQANGKSPRSLMWFLGATIQNTPVIVLFFFFFFHFQTVTQQSSIENMKESNQVSIKNSASVEDTILWNTLDRWTMTDKQ